MFSSVPAEILGLVAGWGFLLIVAAFCFPIRSSYQKPIGKGKIVMAAAVSSMVTWFNGICKLEGRNFI